MKTIIFDLGGVYFTDGTKEAIGKISLQYGIDEQLVFDVFRGEIGREYRKGNITRDQFCKKAIEYWQRPDIFPDRISEIWLNSYHPIQGTVEIIKRLKSKGYKTFFLSGNAPDRVAYLESTFCFLKHFDDGLFSYKVKLSKNDSSLYKRMLEEVNTASENCIYIDDKAELLPLAMHYGIATIHFTSPEFLEKELNKLGIDFD